MKQIKETNYKYAFKRIKRLILSSNSEQKIYFDCLYECFSLPYSVVKPLKMESVQFFLYFSMMRTSMYSKWSLNQLCCQSQKLI